MPNPTRAGRASCCILGGLLLAYSAKPSFGQDATCPTYDYERRLVVGQGYDATVGNVLSPLPGDPGHRRMVLMQQGLPFQCMNIDDCSYEPTAVMVAGKASVHESRARGWQFVGDLGDATAAAFIHSIDAQRIASSASEERVHYFEVVATCQMVAAFLPHINGMVDYRGIQLDSEFRGAVNNMVLTQEWIWPNFISYFGTHFISAVLYGGLRMDRYKVSEDGMARLRQAAQGAFTLESAAESYFKSLYDTYGVQVQGAAQAFQDALEGNPPEILDRSGAPFVANSINGWKSGFADLNNMYSIGNKGNQLVPITELLTAAFFPDDPQIDAKRAFVQQAYESICQHIGCNLPLAPDWDAGVYTLGGLQNRTAAVVV